MWNVSHHKVTAYCYNVKFTFEWGNGVRRTDKLKNMTHLHILIKLGWDICCYWPWYCDKYVAVALYLTHRNDEVTDLVDSRQESQ